MLMTILLVILAMLLIVWQIIRSKQKTLHTLPDQSATAFKMMTVIESASLASENNSNALITDFINQNAIPEALQHFVLLMPETTSASMHKKIIQIVQCVPRPHPILKELLTVEDDAEQLFKLIQNDVEIAAKILQTVNSPAFYLPQKITRLNQAILYLGTNLVRDVAMNIAVQDKIKRSSPAQNQAFRRIWATSFLASSLGFVLARHMNLHDAAELSTHALLLTIGNIALVSFHTQFAEYYLAYSRLLPRVQSEQDELQTNAALIGAALAMEWHLPETLIETIKYSLYPLSIPPELCELPDSCLRKVVFCYAVARLSESIITDNCKDIMDINFSTLNSEEYYFLHDYLAKTNLTELMEALSDVELQKKINNILQQLSSE